MSKAESATITKCGARGCGEPAEYNMVDMAAPFVERHQTPCCPAHARQWGRQAGIAIFPAGDDEANALAPTGEFHLG